MNDMNETEEMDGSSGAESYRAFLDKFVEYGGNPELIKGLAPKAQPTKSRLPHVSTESDPWRSRAPSGRRTCSAIRSARDSCRVITRHLSA